MSRQFSSLSFTGGVMEILKGGAGVQGHPPELGLRLRSRRRFELFGGWQKTMII